MIIKKKKMSFHLCVGMLDKSNQDSVDRVEGDGQ